MSLVKNSLGNLGTRLFSYPIAFISSIIVARYLGPSERGVYGYIAILSSFVIAFFTFGIHAGFRYLISSKKCAFKDIWVFALLISFINGLIVSLIIYFAWSMGYLGEAAKSITKFQIRISFFIIIFSSINTYIQRILIGDDKFKLVNIISIIISIINPFLMVFLVVWLKLRVDGTVITLLISQVILFLYQIIYILKSYGFRLHINFGYLKEASSYGIKSWLGDMSTRANVRLDQVLIGIKFSSKDLGIYSVAVNITELLWVLPDSLGPVLYNLVTKETNINKQAELTSKIHRLIFFITLIGALCMIFFGYAIIRFGFGEKYYNSLFPLLILLPGTLFYVSIKISTKLFSASTNVIKSTYILIFSSLVSVLLYFILIPFFSYIGAAIASSIGYISGAFYAYYLLSKYYNINFRELLFLKRDDIHWAKTKLLKH